MLARGLRIASLALLAAALLVAAGLVRDGWPWAPAIAVALLLVVLLLNGLPLAIEFLVGAAIDPAPGGRLGPLATLRLWWGETRRQIAVFLWAQPWRAGFAEAPLSHRPDRPALLLIHGYLCNRAVWRDWLPALGQRYQVATINLEPVYGAIDGHAPRVAEAIARLKAATGAARVILVGHSMGGLVARETLRQFGDLGVERIITIATPHAGTVFAPLGLGANARQIRPGSDFLTRLAATPCPVPVHCLSARHDNLIVPRASTALPGAPVLWFDRVGHLALSADPRALADLVALIDDPKPN